MDLPRHPLPLVHDAGLPGLGEQLLVQAGVLGQRGLELAVRLAQLGDRLLAPLVLLAADRGEPGKADGHRRVEQQQDGVEQRPLHAVRQATILRGGRGGGDRDGAEQPPAAERQLVREDVAGPGVDAEQRVAQHHDGHQHQQAGHGERQQRRALLPLGMQREEPQHPHGGQRR